MDEIKYRFDDVPPLPTSLLLAFQHSMAAFGSIIAVPLIVGGALGLTMEDSSLLVNAALIASGVGTIIQSRGIGPIGARVPCVMGVSVKFVVPAIQVGQCYGLAGIFGSVISASFLEIALSRFIGVIKKLFPPVVRGCVIMLIGLTFMPVGIGWIGGSNKNLLLAVTVMILIVIFNRSGRGIISAGAVLFSMMIGFIIAVPLGMVEPTNLLAGGMVSFPIPFKYGLTFNISAILPFLVVYVVSMIETIGDLLAIEETCKEKIGSKKLSNGILADGATSTIAGFFNSMPLSSFSQNIGIISLTGVASRWVVTLAGVFFVFLGIFPPIGRIFGTIPQPVIGGAAIVMFGMVTVAGIRLLKDAEMSNKNMLILAISLSLGVGIAAAPQALESLPFTLKMLLSSGITTGSLAAIILNLLIPDKKKSITGVESNVN
ncbi:MAG TPA: purine permease [Thermoplasmata archaeon]|nr:purine permease [Thermoplasmata archaeon]